MRLIDTHCHLNLADSFPDPEPAIAEAAEHSVDRIINVGVDLPSSRRAIELAERHEGLYAVVGIHPNSAAGYRPEQLLDIEEMLRHPKVAAIGEIGLDYHWDFATPAQQWTALQDQLDLSESEGKPVVFHCREAYPDLLDLLEKRQRHAWLFHCFAGDLSDARRAVELGGWFGVDGPITYPKANDLREVVRSLPPDRIVVETDSPYLSPVPLRGRPNRPGNVRFVNAGLGASLGIGEDECGRLTTANAERFFGLP